MEKKISNIIFGSRWLQAPLYLGLVVAQTIYVYRFILELWHLIIGASVLKENDVMLLILGMIDIVMIANLLTMIIIGGYEIFIKDLNVPKDKELEWMMSVNAGLLKVKLSMALIGISSIHLLKTFIAVSSTDDRIIFWQCVIHSIFMISAYIMAKTEKQMH